LPLILNIIENMGIKIIYQIRFMIGLYHSIYKYAFTSDAWYYNSRFIEWSQEKNLILELTQENSSTKYLPYIHWADGLCYTKPSLHIVNMLYNIIISESSMSFCIACDYVTITVTCDGYIIVCDVILNPNPKFKNKKINEK